ncbi:DUF3611 family protein [Nodosilinea sp. LEGE 07298]|uniref:DUF3611 family protein n=1 Tax=Nodosilinea sp. LEGE 07298 TaxID=2777970 RepID=UPI00187F8A27|nr:DUF3611 family protein [Nodosilinea sp. LEGE 07298]MBE9110657.1 DUF3611 family protein [Nodosilinea sp. LEGE 07298]
MFDFLRAQPSSPSPGQIARFCRTLGWAGLILQSLLGVVPLLVVIARILVNPQWRDVRSSAGLWLALLGLAILLFSIYWCFRYIRMARRLEDPDLRPAKSAVQRNLKLGLLSNLALMSIGVLLALWRVTLLSIKMLTIPQGTTVVSPGAAAVPGGLITPSSMIAIQAMVSAIAAGLVGVVIALLLIYQVGRHRTSPDLFT